ncbi:MAG: zinc ribbon domain-containing protein [Anaerolineales bacterium]|nr:zinc ribbon domain-containing protein [Anaerolineales bacterium]
MPIYTYRCSHCGVQFDIRQSFQDESLSVCPECGETALNKVFQPVGIVFKGSGFYSTDNRSPSGQVPERAPKEEKTETSKANKEGTTESKPSPSKSTTTEE